MRTYILALSKYVITAGMLVYTLLAFLRLGYGSRRGEGAGTALRKSAAADFCMIFLLFLVHAAGLLTIYAARQKPEYLFFWLFQLLAFAAAIVLYRAIYPEGNTALWLNVCMLLSIGLVMLTRLSFAKAVRQFFIAAAGMSLAIAVPALLKRFRFLKRLTFVYAGAGAAALLAVLVLGQVTQGSKLSYSMFGVSVQPSEFVKILFVFYLASAYYEAAGLREILPAAAVSAVHILILAASRDLGTAAIYFVAYVFMTFLASGKWRYLFLGMAAGGAGAAAGFRLFAHVRVRVQAWLDPWSVIDTMGYQITQSLFSISGGGIFGTGLTRGTPDKIPYVESDFIFAAVAEELGLIFAVCLMALCIAVFLDILWVSLNFADRFYRFTAFGFAVIYIFQIFLTIGGEVKFIPLTGVTLPLISYGGSSVLQTIFMFAVVEAIYILQREKMRSFEQRFEREEAAARRAVGRGG
ncbi:FtsW/RodA/SpoVE family cell cycle protein [Lachnoclostridium sp. Marseille-P6806]|uniref:FtsW/RodA/SpoVE family cell cycle protein n=1 Tax=Lachnoclostridium sp. Marseille-P6806 TaxID=2364793 RepID=UPI001031F3BD|nr:FtsW/RodA/SpoVE family cell cycle protein [Lachnoclostridium sp. Marseille-P6806]